MPFMVMSPFRMQYKGTPIALHGSDVAIRSKFDRKSHTCVRCLLKPVRNSIDGRGWSEVRKGNVDTSSTLFPSNRGAENWIRQYRRSTGIECF